MKKESNSQWERYKMNTVIRQKGCDRKQIQDDLSVKLQKSVVLDDDMLKMVWLIRKINKALRTDKQVVREALSSFLSHQV